jgi:hypothetical protein
LFTGEVSSAKFLLSVLSFSPFSKKNMRIELSYILLFNAFAYVLHAEHSTIRFLTIGDWGSPGHIQSAVAEQMAASAASNHIDFIISVGDNFYEV